VPPLAAKAAVGGDKSPKAGGKSRKTDDFTLEKEQKDEIQGPQRIVQWSQVMRSSCFEEFVSAGRTLANSYRKRKPSP